MTHPLRKMICVPKKGVEFGKCLFMRRESEAYEKLRTEHSNRAGGKRDGKSRTQRQGMIEFTAGNR